MAKKAWMHVRNARKKKGGRKLRILVTKAQANVLGEFFGDVGCPFTLRVTGKVGVRGKKRKAGRKK